MPSPCRLTLAVAVRAFSRAAQLERARRDVETRLHTVEPELLSTDEYGEALNMMPPMMPCYLCHAILIPSPMLPRYS